MTLIERINTLKLPARLAILGAVIAAMLVVAIPIALATSGWLGVAAAVVAAVVCKVSGGLALVVAYVARTPDRLLWGVLGAMVVRLMIPLGVAFIVEFHVEALANAGFVYYLVPFYLLTLAAETPLALPAAGEPSDGPAERERDDTASQDPTPTD